MIIIRKCMNVKTIENDNNDNNDTWSPSKSNSFHHVRKPVIKFPFYFLSRAQLFALVLVPKLLSLLLSPDYYYYYY